MRSLAVALAISLAAPAVARADVTDAQLGALADRLGAHAPRSAMDLYAQAFAGYALVDGCLASPARCDAKSRGRIDRLIARMAATRPGLYGAGASSVAGRSLSASVAVRGHLVLLLVGRSLLGALSDDEAALRDALARELADSIKRARTHLLPTYGRRVWPADNEVARAALAAYLARVRDDAAVRAAWRELSDTLDGLERRGLPPSELVPGSLAARDVPRGCALSWTVAMRALCEPTAARRLWLPYRRSHLVEVGPVVGLREWPRGVDRPADADSGPIVLGIGVAASGIGLGAARTLGARDDYRRLAASARLAGLGLVERSSPIPVVPAMAAWAERARPWCE